MTHATPEERTVFGYLSAVQSTEHGYFGGYLLVSPLGRPLEFHCTAPVRPSRAQEILYGPTLRSYLIGEQIDSNLLGAAKSTPRLILVDHIEAIGATRPSTIPLVLLQSWPVIDNEEHRGPGVDDKRASTEPLEPSSGGAQGWSAAFTAFDYQLRHPSGSESQRADIVALLSLLAERVDLAEPFGRIHEAIREAQRIGAQASDERGQAA
jgi:hypothetical protein